MADERRKTREIPFPSLIESENPTEALRGTWSTLIGATTAIEALVRSANDADREAIRTIARALDTLGTIIGRGNGDALGELANWSEKWRPAPLPREPEPVPSSPDRIVVAYQADPVGRPVAPNAYELARDIRETWARRTRDFESSASLLRGGIPPKLRDFKKENPNAILWVLTISREAIEAAGLLPDIPAQIPRPGDGSGDALDLAGFLLHVPMTRAAVAWDLAQMLQPLTEPWFMPGDEGALASRIYERMPLHNPLHPSGRATDRARTHVRAPFVERHDRTIVAAFKAAGCPSERAENLFPATER